MSFDRYSSDTITEGDYDRLLSKFRRCLCKYTSPNNVSICYLDDSNSNYYHDGTRANLTGSEGDVMVYFPEFWYKGVTTEEWHQFNFSLTERSGFHHAPASLVGVYLYKSGISTGSWSDREIGRNWNPKYEDLIGNVSYRGDGFHIINYLQHSTILWMGFVKYGRSINLGVYGHYSWPEVTGTTNSLGMTDTTPETANIGTGVMINLLGIEGAYNSGYTLIEGIKLYRGSSDSKDTIRIWYNGIDEDFSNEMYHIVPAHLMTSSGNSYFIQDIVGGEYCDVLPELSGIEGDDKLYPGTNHLSDTGGIYIERSGCSGSTAGGFIFISNVSLTYNSYNHHSRLAFDGNITVVDDVDTFKSIGYVINP